MNALTKYAFQWPRGIIISVFKQSFAGILKLQSFKAQSKVRRFCANPSKTFSHDACTYTVEPPIKDAPNKGHLRIKDAIQSTKKSLSYSASTFLTSESRTPLNKGHLLWSPGVLYSEVPLYMCVTRKLACVAISEAV